MVSALKCGQHARSLALETHQFPSMHSVPDYLGHGVEICRILCSDDLGVLLPDDPRFLHRSYDMNYPSGILHQGKSSLKYANCFARARCGTELSLKTDWLLA